MEKPKHLSRRTSLAAQMGLTQARRGKPGWTGLLDAWSIKVRLEYSSLTEASLFRRFGCWYRVDICLFRCWSLWEYKIDYCNCILILVSLKRVEIIGCLHYPSFHVVKGLLVWKACFLSVLEHRTIALLVNTYIGHENGNFLTNGWNYSLPFRKYLAFPGPNS